MASTPTLKPASQRSFSDSPLPGRRGSADTTPPPPSQKSDLRQTPKLSIATATPVPSKAPQNGAAETPEPARTKSPTRKRKSIDESAPTEEALSQAMLEIESLLTSFDWTHPTPCATRVETMLLDELEAVESENVHSLVMNDGPHMVDFISRIDDGIHECEELDEMLTLYLVELQSLADDVNLIESDNRGLHVRTANERELEKELSDLLATVSISPREFEMLKQESMEKSDGIERVQQGLLKLYQALKSSSGLVEQDDEGPKGGMQIVREMRRMTRQESDKFLARFKDFVKVKFQVFPICHYANFRPNYYPFHRPSQKQTQFTPTIQIHILTSIVTPDLFYLRRKLMSRVIWISNNSISVPQADLTGKTSEYS
jgi:exocyst complex component 1